MKTKLSRLFAAVSCIAALSFGSSQAHNLDTIATSISFANDYMTTFQARAANGDPLVQVGDEFWVLLKTTPGPGTQTGVGGYQTFYPPAGMEVIDAAYVFPDTSDPRGFRNIPMKGQSPIAIGNGSIAQSLTPELVGFSLPGFNGLGTKSDPVTAAGRDRGTLAGVYADTGIFFSTDPRTAFSSYPGAPMTNNSGDTVGELFAANIPNAQQRNVQGVMTLWDSYQLRAYGRKDIAPILDTTDGRGNAPWGLANVVPGPQSGYAWEFDAATYDSTAGTHAQKMRAAIKIGPWHRIQYPGSQISQDQPGLISNTLGQAGVDASLMGIPSTAIPSNTTAIRFAIGQLELGRPELSAVKVRVVTPPAQAGCLIMHGDAFGGDAGGTDGGKDHIWRYFDPTVVTLNPCNFLQKVASKSLVAPGEVFYYDITFANTSGTAVPNVVITDVLPNGLIHVSATPTPTSGSGLTWNWNIGTVQPDDVVTIRQYVRATGTGTLFNTATARSNNVVVGIAQQSVEVGTRSVLIKSKSVNVSNAAPGDVVAYTLEIENIGTGKSGTPMVVRDTLPPGFTYQSFGSAILNGASISSPAITINSTDPTKPFFTINQGIDPGKKLFITFNCLIGETVQPGTYFNEFLVEYEKKILPPIPEAPVIIGGGQIGDTVFRDWDGDGTQDAAELGLPGVTVNLYEDTDNNGSYETLVGTKVTDANGYYVFTGLQPGNYQVQVPSPGSGGVPSGYTLTADPNGAPLTTSYNVNLALNQVVDNADWGYQPGGSGTIGDQAFEDLNKNGVWNSGELGIPNVAVNLYVDNNGNGLIDSGDLLIDTTTTNGSGIYSFSGLDTTRNYLVQINPLDSAVSTYFTNVYGDAANQLTSINPFPVAAGFTTVTTADFGFWRAVPATIGDQVFIDSNLNGVFDNGDAPIGNVTVNLFASDGITLLATTVSGPDGTYFFTGLPAGSYVVKVDTTDPDVPSGYTASVSTYNVTLAAGDQFITADFPFISVFSKNVDLAAADPGDILTYTMFPYWPGPSLLTNAKVTDEVPAGTTFVSANQGGFLGNPPISSTPGVPGSHPGAPGSGSMTLTAVKDTYLNADSPTLNYGASTSLIENRGGGDTLGTRHILVQFDLTAIPAGASITSAEFRMTKSSTNNPNVGFQIYPLLKAWNEGTGGAGGAAGAASFNQRLASTAWTGASTAFDPSSPSVDFGSQLAQTTVNAAGTYTWSGASLTSQVSSWYTTPANNFGLVMGSSNTGTDDTVWNSRTNAGTKPELVVNYTAPSAPATTTTITASPTPVTDSGSGVNVTVSMTVTATGAVNNIVPSALTVIPGGFGANATYVSGPTNSPASIGAGGGSAVFTWVYNVTGGSSPDQVRFSGNATGTGATFGAATSNGVVVTIPNPSDNLVTWNLGTNTPAVNGSDSGSGGPVDATITSTKSTWNYEDEPTRNYGADPALVLESNSPFRCYSFAEFDFASIPAGATINSATLRLVHSNLTNAFGDTEAGDPFTVGVRRLTRSWVEGTALNTAQAGSLTWNSAGPAAWTTAGGDFAATNYGSFVGGASDALGTVYSVNVLTLANEWYQGTQANNGLILVPLNNPGGGDHFFSVFSDDATNDANRPKLLINYTPAASAATTTSITTSPVLVTDAGSGVNVSVSMTVTATGAVTNITAPANLTVAGTNGANATKVSGPTGTPVSFGSGGGSATFTWVYNVTSGSTPGQVTFSGTPTGTGATFGAATSNGIIVTEPLTMQVQVISPNPGVPLVNNIAQFFNGPDFLAEDNAITSLSASIGDYVWLDADGDGLQDAGEFGIGGVTVNLFAADGTTLLDSTVTDAAGGYRFFGLGAGDYVVSYDLDSAPAGYFGTTPLSVPVTLAASQQFNDADFGLNVLPPGTGSIGDYVWFDANNDGIQDPEESAIPGVGITLERFINGIWVPVGSAVTDSNGFYSFTGLSAGDYRVSVDPTSQITSPYAQGTFDLGAVTSPTFDADGIGTPNVTLVTLATNSTVIDNTDFGYNWSGSIGDLVWWDYDTDGLPDESPLVGVVNARVQLYFDHDFDGVFDRIAGDYEILRVFTDANGAYTIPNLPPGNYFVDVYEDSITTTGVRNVVPTTDDIVPVTLAPGNMDVDTADFGYFEGARVEALVFWDANGNGFLDPSEELLEPVTVTLTGTDNLGNPITRTLESSADGYVAFLVPEGNYTISYDPADVNASYPALGTETTPTSFAFTATAGEDGVRFFEFGVDNTGSIGDTIFADVDQSGTQDPGEPGIPNITVNLYLDVNGDGILDFNAGDELLAVTTTDPSGNYLFTGLEDTVASGEYVVEVVTSTLSTTYLHVPTAFPVGADTVNSTYATALTNGESIDLVDFGYPIDPGVNQNFYTVAGTVYHDNGNAGGTSGDGSQNGAEPGIGAVSVLMEIDADNNGIYELAFILPSDGSGNYSYAAVPEGANVRVTVIESTLPNPAYVQTGDPDGGALSNVWLVTNVQANVSDIDFGYLESLGTIAGTVVEGDGNGIADIGEPAIDTVTVTLTYAGPDGILGTADDVVTTTTTDTNGDYVFTDLLPGPYEITTDIPSPLLELADADGGNPNSINVNLAAGQDITNRDFEYQEGTISGVVWTDSNADGIRTGGEPLLQAVTVFLDLDNNGTLDPGEPTEATDVNGFYQFTGLLEGTYPVRVDPTTLPAGSIQSYDLDGVLTPHLATVTVGINEDVTNVDFGYYQLGSIAGQVEIDTTGDNQGDDPQQGVLISLLDENGNPVLDENDVPITTETDAFGNYVFPSLPPGSYQVTQTVPSGFTAVDDADGGPDFALIGDPTPIVVNSGQNVTGQDFVNSQFASIAGNVFNDTNGLTDNTVNGTGTDAGGLFINLVDPLDNTVIASLPVNLDGTYLFDDGDGVEINSSYLLILTSDLQTVGNVLTAATLPLPWASTGENLGAGAGSDGTPNGILSVATTTGPLTNANFGLDQVPDVSPIVTAIPNVMTGPTPFNLIIRCRELNVVDTNGLITIRVPKDVRWVLSEPYQPTLTSLSGIPLDNSLWTYSENATQHIFQTTAVITGNDSLYFGMRCNWNSGLTQGIFTITSQIDAWSGGENRIDNNSDAEKLDYFIN